MEDEENMEQASLKSETVSLGEDAVESDLDAAQAESGNHFMEQSDDSNDEDENEIADVDVDDNSNTDLLATLTAQPPRFLSSARAPFEVSSNSAISVLDQLVADGTITATKLSLLKSLYNKYLEELKVRQMNEQNLKQEVKDCANTLEQQKKELSTAEEFPDNCDSEVARLRCQLLKYNNDLEETWERNYQLNYKIECLMEDKGMLQKEAERLPKPGEQEKTREDLKVSCTDLNKEINQRKQEIKTMTEDLDSVKRQHNLKIKELDVLKEQENKLQSDLAGIFTEPQAIQKEREKLQRKKNECEKNCREIERQIKEGRMNLIGQQTRMEEVEEKKFTLERNAKEKMTICCEKERTLQIIMKDLNYALDKESALHSDRVALDMNLNQVSHERNNAHDVHTRKLREKDSEMKGLKKAELRLRVMEESLVTLQQSHSKLQLEMNSLPKDDGSARRKIEELRKEIDQTARAIAAQSGLSAEETLKLEQSIASGERLMFEMNDLRVELIELSRLASIKTEEKVQKSRDLKKAEQHYMDTKQELVTKSVVLDDHKRREQDLLNRLKEFSNLYNVIKNERNKCVGLIQASNQKASEMKEKMKILQNEIEILRTSATLIDRHKAAHRETTTQIHENGTQRPLQLYHDLLSCVLCRKLQKHILRNVHGVVSRDTVRNEMCRRQKLMIDLKSKREHNIMTICHLESLIKKCEDEMIELRKRYEIEVKNRNERGIQLVERNQEVCIFYEKLNIQDQTMRNGHVELLAREDDIRILKLQLAEEKRTIDLLKKSLPNKRAIEKQLVNLQIELAQHQDRLADLELAAENPTEDRVRFIEGRVLSPPEIQNKLQQLEERLAIKEAQLMEKELIRDHVERITERVYKEVASGKDDTLILAKKMNQYQWKTGEMTRKMKATVSELAMHQAQSLRLQQELREKESELEQCYRRMEQGLAPTPDIEQEWFRRSTTAIRNTTKIEDEDDLPLDGARTRAEARPNAYLPTDEYELAIPRPYGGHAPFKPTEPGSNMRHIRRPVSKPIEL